MQRLRYLSTIVSDVGDIFVFVAPVTCVPLLVALIYAEWNMLLPMASVPHRLLPCRDALPGTSPE